MTNHGVRPKTPPPGPPAPKPVPPPGAKMDDDQIVPMHTPSEPVLMPDLPPFPFITSQTIAERYHLLITAYDGRDDAPKYLIWKMACDQLDREQERVTRIWEAFGKKQ